MSIIESIKTINPNLIIIILISLVFLLQIIQIFLLKKMRKPGKAAKPGDDQDLNQDLKRFISSEMNRIKQEIISIKSPAPSETKKNWEYLFPDKQDKQEKEIAVHQPVQYKEKEPLPEPEPKKTDLPPEVDYEEDQYKPLMEPGELDSMEEEMDLKSPGEIVGGDDLQTCVEQYNEAITNEDRQIRFLDEYRPLRVDVINALERRRRADLSPMYQTADNGDYYVVELLNNGRTSYVVLPRFDLLIKDSNYKAGAFGEVFDCPDYEQNERFHIKRVINPAYFEKRRNDSWELSARGRIMLLLE